MDISQVWPEWHEDCVLGEGSFGKVYRAKRVEYGRTFYSAIKVLTVPKSQQEIKHARSQGMDDNAIYDYFRSLVDNLLNEITLMDNLKGAQNVVGIEDYKIVERQGEIGWDIFIRMELLTPFDSFVSNPDFSQKDIIKLGVDICSALEVCEQNYIVHRDIKPDNIFVSRFGEYKLGDFGIARRLEAAEANLSRKGTLNYMAPEVYKSQPYGSNVDIYSLGMVLYTLLNNNRIALLPPYPQPITYKDNEEALAQRLSGAPFPLPCNASPSLGMVINRACAYDPRERYQSATEFKNALINEWNCLVQTGESRELGKAEMRFGTDVNGAVHNNTNDMTGNSRLVADEYSMQGTTVLEQSQYGNTQNDYYRSQNFEGSYSYENVQSSYPAQTYSNAKSNVLCRFLALPLALVCCVLGAILWFGAASAANEKLAGMAICGLGLAIVVIGRSRLAAGLCIGAMSIPYIVLGLSELLGEVGGELSVSAIVITLSGLLMLCGGVAVSVQKEVRFGGSLCIYAIVAEWLFNVYLMINGNFSCQLWHIYMSVAAFTAFIWSYGYDSRTENSMIHKIIFIVLDIVAAFIAGNALIYAFGEITKIFG